MKNLTAERVIHDGKSRVALRFPYDKYLIALVKELPDAMWSNTLKAWHIPDSKGSIEQLRSLLPGIKYTDNISDDIPVTGQERSDVVRHETSRNYKRGSTISIEVSDRRIFIKLPKNEEDCRFLPGLRYSRWDRKLFCWIIPNYHGNLDLIKDYYKERISELTICEEIEATTKCNTRRLIGKADLLVIKTNSGRVKVIFGFSRGPQVVSTQLQVYRQ